VSGIRTSADRLGRDGQRGIVMWVALVVLIVMSLAGLAMMRQMGTGISVAGNVAFKQNATSTADVGTEAARAWFVAQPTVVLESDAVAQGVLRDLERHLGIHGRSDAIQLGHRRGDGDGRRRRGRHRHGQHQPIHHPAAVPGPGSVQAPPRLLGHRGRHHRGKGSCDYSTATLPPSFKPYFRVTTRVVGPRNTVSFTQVILN
jgi:hypothetical protein